jgi:hypothetical protein
MDRLFALVRYLPELVHYYLRQHVFPATMNFQALKVYRMFASPHICFVSVSLTPFVFASLSLSLPLDKVSACGHELGSSALFDRRIGFRRETMTADNVASFVRSFLVV